MSGLDKRHRGKSWQNQGANWNVRPSFSERCAKVDRKSCCSQQVHS
jgi:hypothetical protein